MYLAFGGSPACGNSSPHKAGWVAVAWWAPRSRAEFSPAAHWRTNIAWATGTNTRAHKCVQYYTIYYRLTWWEETGSRLGSFSLTAADAESLNSWGLAVYSSAGLKMTASSPEPWWSAHGPPASPAQGLSTHTCTEWVGKGGIKTYFCDGHIRKTHKLADLTFSDLPELVFSELWTLFKL